jgi:hypothetical protein
MTRGWLGTLVVAALCGAAAPAHAVLGPNYFGTAYEAFDYPVGTVLGPPEQANGGLGWNAGGLASLANDAGAYWGNYNGGANGVSPTTSTPASRSVDGSTLSYAATGYAPSKGGKAVLDALVSNVSIAVGRNLGQEVSAGVFWFSYLTERNNDVSRTTNLAFFGPVTGPPGTPAGVDDRFAFGQLGIGTPGAIDTGGNFSLHFNGANPANVLQSLTPIPYGVSLTHLILGRVKFDDGAANAFGGVNDTVEIWVDPTNVTSLGALGAPYLYSSDYELASISAIRLFAGGANFMQPGMTRPPVSTDFDEIRLGSSLQSVVVPEPAALALATAAGAFTISACRRRTRRSTPQRMELAN